MMGDGMRCNDGCHTWGPDGGMPNVAHAKAEATNAERAAILGILDAT